MRKFAVNKLNCRQVLAMLSISDNVLSPNSLYKGRLEALYISETSVSDSNNTTYKSLYRFVTAHLLSRLIKNTLRKADLRLSFLALGLSCATFGLSCAAFGSSYATLGSSYAAFGLSCTAFGLSFVAFGYHFAAFGHPNAMKRNHNKAKKEASRDIGKSQLNEFILKTI